MPDFLLLLADGQEISGAPGESVLAALRGAGATIQSVCGGRGMCGTCRILVAEDWMDKLLPPDAQETRVLSVLRAGKKNHRLACQLVLEARLTGIEILKDPPPTRTVLKETVS
jgi:ferredoxin